MAEVVATASSALSEAGRATPPPRKGSPKVFFLEGWWHLAAHQLGAQTQRLAAQAAQAASMAARLRDCFPARPAVNSWEHKAVSPSGQETYYHYSRMKDLEDDDTSETVRIGTLELKHDDDRGRDFAQSVFTVSYKGSVVCVSQDARARET